MLCKFPFCHNLHTFLVMTSLYTTDNMLMYCRGSWLLFYIIEAVAIMAVLKQHPNDAVAAVSASPQTNCCSAFCRSMRIFDIAQWLQDKALKNTITIPKRMLPLRLAVFKQLLLRNNKMVPATNTVSAFTDTPSSESQIFGPTFGMPEGLKTLPKGRSSSTVLDRPASPDAGVQDEATSIVESPVRGPVSEQVSSAPASATVGRVAEKVENNIVVGPQVVDSPVTKQNKPEGGVPLAQPIDARTLERRRQQKGLKPGKLQGSFLTILTSCSVSAKIAASCQLHLG